MFHSSNRASPEKLRTATFAPWTLWTRTEHPTPFSRGMGAEGRQERRRDVVKRNAGAAMLHCLYNLDGSVVMVMEMRWMVEMVLDKWPESRFCLFLNSMQICRSSLDKQLQ